MLSEIRSNGALHIRLTSDKQIEQLVIETFNDAIRKGQSVTVAPAPEDNCTLVISLYV